MFTLREVLVLISILLFVLAAFGWPASKIGIGWLGLAFLAASFAVV